MFFRPLQALEFNGRASTCGCLGRHRGWKEFICESDLSSRVQRMVTIILNASLYVSLIDIFAPIRCWTTKETQQFIFFTRTLG